MQKRIRTELYARRRKSVIITALAAPCAGLLLLVNGVTAQAEPPAPPSASEAKTMLEGLNEQAEGSMDGYDREKFPHWSDQGEGCDTREAVLKRDGDGVETGSDCQATSGSWTSPYDGETWTNTSDVDIDHMVPLAESWTSGASEWTDAEREKLANDMSIAQLLAVTDNVNQSKSDRDPAEWMPPKNDYHCTYARMWIWVKDTYDLTADSAEKGALTEALGTC
ncbi:HNH endonuclease family protein [Streptomyces albidus (ex Kaewkla and Franco 2022)]|uniref:HNH endonuclease family protein n=1 Tax=Streptomyces albidus (ex Kaewkla and Franco 2022) TaxID=722709 RepID=UPI0015EF6C3B|nr:HNH endonuclease family protein [Streptomyces albidus (ex Kaewkla and Franco 2022)]